MTDPDIVTGLRTDAALFGKMPPHAKVNMNPEFMREMSQLWIAAANEIERLRARPCCLERLEQIRELEAALRDRNTELQRVRDQRDAMRSAYSTAEQTALELFLQRNAAREALERHADGEGR